MTDKALEAALTRSGKISDGYSFDFKGKTYYRSRWSEDAFGRTRSLSTMPFTGHREASLRSALPGEAEVVGHIHTNPKFGSQLTVQADVAGLEARYGWSCTPLVTLASLQAMQARAEKAERERDEALGVLEGVDGLGKKLVDDLKARVKELEEALNLFREFVLRNATQWKLGAGHHHPMWQLVAELLHGTPEIQNGPEWQFIWPENKKPLEDLRTALKGGSNG